MFRRIFLGILVVMLAGCASLPSAGPTVENDFRKPEFQTGNLPVRTLTVVVLIADNVTEHETRLAFEEASKHLEEQLGVRLDIIRIEHAKFKRSMWHMQRDLRNFRTKHPDEDIVASVDLSSDFVDDWLGLILGQTREWRNIALRSLDAHVIMHEVGHTLLPWRPHAHVGIMTPTSHGDFFTEEEHRIIEHTKWRDYRRALPWWETLFFSL